MSSDHTITLTTARLNSIRRAVKAAREVLEPPCTVYALETAPDMLEALIALLPDEMKPDGEGDR